MSPGVLWACVRKESLLLARDPHGLLLLFVMPAMFILIMSLALQEQFSGHRAAEGGYIDVLILDEDKSRTSERLTDRLAAHVAIHLVDVEVFDEADMRRRLEKDEAAFGVRIKVGFTKAISSSSFDPANKLHVSVSAGADRPREHVLLGVLREALGRLRVEQLLQHTASNVGPGLGEPGTGPQVEYLYREGKDTKAPTSVQQNVPAWLVFGVFFVVVPLSTTMIRERQLGMERRLHTTPVPQAVILAGKLLPYFLVNQLQVAMMLAVGVFLVPALGGDPLSLAGVPLDALVVVAMALSLAALGYALLVAVVSRTTEQATMLGGAGNIILAAIGGIMVPKFIMPPTLQTLTQVSPMAWGLDGLLVPVLHGGGIGQAAFHILVLTGFGVATITLAWLLQRRLYRY